jgi:hypothetical protein
VVRLHGSLHPVEFAHQLDADPVAPPVFRLDDGRPPVAGEDQVHSPIGPSATAHLAHPIPVTAEGIGDDLLELLPAERGEVAERALVVQATRSHHGVAEGGEPDYRDADDPGDDDERRGIVRTG